MSSKSNPVVVAVASILILFMCIGAPYTLLSLNYQNKAVEYEELVSALSKSSESTLSNGTLAILDKASIKDSYAEDFQNSLRTAIDGRYGNDSGLAMKWIQEQNPALSVALYQDISSYIEGMRSDFKISQDRIVDACRSYNVLRRKAFSGFFLSEYPTAQFNADDCEIVSDAKSREAFKTKVQTQIL